MISSSSFRPASFSRALMLSALVALIPACNKAEKPAASGSAPAASSGNVDLSKEDQKLSYGIGYNMGSEMSQQGDFTVDAVALRAGVEDGLAKAPTRIAKEDIQAAFLAIRQRLETQVSQTAEKQLAEGAAFLEQNKQRPAVTTTASGLQYEVIKEGSGDKPQISSTVEVSYHGTLIDGTVFDSSVERGDTAEFPVTGVIAGWTEALQLMPVGSKWKLFVPAALAYGPRGRPGIPGNAVLIFEVELLKIK